MNRRYIITNRGIHNEKIEGSSELEYVDLSRPETIKVSGEEPATDHLRFAWIDGAAELSNYGPDPNAIIQLYPHSILDEPQVNALQASQVLKGSAALFTNLYTDMCDTLTGGDVLIFIHGYNTDLKDAISQLDALERAYIRADSPIRHIVLFTWPARSSILRYRDDIRDSIESGRALMRALIKLQVFFEHFFRPQIHRDAQGRLSGATTHPLCNRHLHLMAHSTGVRVLEHAMQFLKSSDIAITYLLEEVVLVAADVDEQALERGEPLSLVCQLSKRVHTYNNKKDLALVWSKSFKNPYPRLGQKGVRDHKNVPGNVVMVDITTSAIEANLRDRLIAHWYYYESPSVVEDIIQVLKGVPARDIAVANPNALEKRVNWPHIPNLYWIEVKEELSL